MQERTQPDPKSEIQLLTESALEVWVRRLIDRSRANSLLFYRDLKVGTLDLSGSRDVVDRLLAGETISIEALLPPAPEESDPDRAQRQKERDDERTRIRRALVGIQRKALGNLEEKGIETLSLALGMATWPASDGGRPYDAPVLLIPARFESRRRTTDEPRLSLAGEPHINPVLTYILEELFSLKLDTEGILAAYAREDASGRWTVDPECVLSRVEDDARGAAGFGVRRRAVLGNFQFAKMAMVEDLRRNAATLARSPIVAAIAGHQESRGSLAEAVDDAQFVSLDERRPSDDYLVLDADSTQQRAIVLACKGQSGVIQGPPGTGKSQTIANLIAQLASEGRRVLFVAEKRAALDAVIKRLNSPSIGLGHLVLDVHGASVSRKEVMARLNDSLYQICHAQPAIGFDVVHREFEAKRAQLNAHSRCVNCPREPAGLSINEIIGRLLRLPDAARSDLRLPDATLAALTQERFEHVSDRLDEAGTMGGLLLGTSASPWNGADIRDGDTARQVVSAVGRAVGDLWPSMLASLGAVMRRLPVREPQTVSDLRDMLDICDDVRDARERYAEQAFCADPARIAEALTPARRGLLPRLWAFATDSRYRAARREALSLRIGRASTRVLLAEAHELADILHRWSGVAPTSEIPRVDESIGPLRTTYDALARALASIDGVLPEPPFSLMSLTAAGERLRALAQDQRTPYQIPVVTEIRNHMVDAGLDTLLEDLRNHPLPPDQWSARLEHVWLRSSLDTALAAEPTLATFNGRSHDQLVADFARLDRERLRLAAERARRVTAERAIVAMDQHSEQTLLVKREAAKRSRHIPLRELLVRAPDVLTRLAPCWVASPLSVSQLLDGGGCHFDVVIFDEASQVLQEEAVPSLYRAPQVIVAGDRHQLPPTTFFASTIEDEDDSTGESPEEAAAKETAVASIGGFESVLDTLSAFLPNWMLEWHYRSEDERLIAFSNVHIYDRRLVTFPSARAHQAIGHVLVPSDSALGAQEESASREVEEVVRLVLAHARSRPEESLGVIAMGIKHANRIQASLDRALEGEDDLGPFFAMEKEDRFFVKNLETVQGDERDAIILTVGYGKTPDGDLPHRFGPLTQETGYRRLNVAVTRARRRITLVSSFSHQEVDLDRSGSRGVRLLKAYLEYAASGGSRLPLEEAAGDIGLNAFEADVRDALQARGIHIRSQFGASRYRIDLVAMHPQKPGRAVLAIECDGASYHSSATARDRDRLRQEHLMRLGWRFHRIWSTDWFYAREAEIERAERAFREAVQRADSADGADETPAGESDAPRESRTPNRSGARPSSPRPYLQRRDDIEQYTDRELASLVEWVLSDGLLRTEEDLMREVLELLPFARLGSRIRDRLTAVIRGVRGGRR